MSEPQPEHVEAIAEALRRVFGEGVAEQRFVDVSKIPLLCRSVVDIHESLKEIKTMLTNLDRRYVSKETFNPVRNVVYSGVGLILLTVAGAILTVIIKK